MMVLVGEAFRKYLVPEGIALLMGLVPNKRGSRELTCSFHRVRIQPEVCNPKRTLGQTC